MIILAIDTSSPVASAAIMRDGVVVGEYRINNGKTHSQIIVPLISDMLEKSGILIDEVDVFATTLGPGSFTGLRIGIATAKSFAQATDKKIIGVSSLEALSANVAYCEDLLISPIMDARRGNVYNATFENGVYIKKDRLIHITDVLKEVEGRKTLFLGDGVAKHKDTIISSMGESAVFAPSHLNELAASSVAKLAYTRAIENDFDDLFASEPIYIRPSQAERELMGQND